MCEWGQWHGLAPLAVSAGRWVQAAVCPRVCLHVPGWHMCTACCDVRPRPLVPGCRDLLQIHWPDRYVPLFGKLAGVAHSLHCTLARPASAASAATHCHAAALTGPASPICHLSALFCLLCCAGAQPYDQANEREGDIPFEEQLRGLEKVVKAGKVCMLLIGCRRPA